jgi:peroxiredoxin
MRSNVKSIVAAFVLGVITAPAWAVEFGEKAPELEPTAWAQGDAVKVAGGAGNHVFVLTFISTFRPECQQVLPGAQKLLDKYGAKGLEVVAVTTESAKEVKDYLAEHAFGFRIATDEDENTRAAYKVKQVPYAFVIDRSGAVVFMGDPGDGMEKTVDDVMSGKFDLKRALDIRKLHADLRKAQRRRVWTWTITGGVQQTEEPDAPDEDGDAPASKDAPADPKAAKETADSIADKILDIDATDSDAFDQRCSSFDMKKDIEGYRKFVKGYVDRVKDDAKTLSSVAWKLITDNRNDWRDPELALAASRRAIDLSKSADADILDTYGHVLARLSLLDAAIEQEKKAIAIDAKNEDFKTRLAFYEACAAARAKAGGAPPAKPKK